MTLSRRLALVAMVACLAGPATESLAQTPSQSLSIRGEVKTPLTVSVDDLKAFPADQIGSFTVTRKVDGQERSSTVRGVRLSALVERAGLAPTGRHEWKHLAVIASATDGYRVAFSWPELINTEVGPGVLVVFERDGQPLDAGEGRIALVSARDVRAGPRHVKWLNTIELRLL
ncbi:MAG: sulfite oxidase-like oxidoreductase [Burkholderiales bacterium]|nr:MAG: sulfite oxidase-like oxidoreductase [Burkholderiales bacterium]